VVWNAAYAAGGLLQNDVLLQQPSVAAGIPALLLLLVVLVRDSSNYKIKVHAAAALGAVKDRAVYGELFADALLVLAGMLESLDSSSSSSNGASCSGWYASAAAAAGDKDGNEVGSTSSGSAMRSCPALSAAAAAAAAAAATGSGHDGSAATAEEEDGSFPNFRCVLLMVKVLQSSVCLSQNFWAGSGCLLKTLHR